MVKMVLAWRLKAAGINAAQVYYDMANAFACGNFDDQDEVLKYRCPENYQILAETYREAIMTMEVKGEWIHVKPSTGISSRACGCCGHFQRNLLDEGGCLGRKGRAIGPVVGGLQSS